MVSVGMSPGVSDVGCLFVLLIGHLYIFSGEVSVPIPCPVLTVEFCGVELWSCLGVSWNGVPGASTPLSADDLVSCPPEEGEPCDRSSVSPPSAAPQLSGLSSSVSSPS